MEIAVGEKLGDECYWNHTAESQRGKLGSQTNAKKFCKKLLYEESKSIW